MSPATSADGHQPGPPHQRHRSQPNTAASQPQHRHARPEFVVPLTDPRAQWHGPAEAAQRQDTDRESDGKLSARLTEAMMRARAREQLNPGRRTPHHVTSSRSPSESRRLQCVTYLAALENMEALERVVEGAPDLEEQGRRGHPHASLNLSGSAHRSPASSSKRSTSQQFVQPQQHETPYG